MLVFAASDKGGTGRSVTSCNIVYRQALRGLDACYLDFDFGSPTAGMIFHVESVGRGTRKGGVHSYLQGVAASPDHVDVWTESERPGIRGRPPGAGRLTLFPGDLSGGEFSVGTEVVKRCADLFLRLEEEFDCCFVDLSAGRSYATELVLAATALSELRDVPYRWLVFHRWTRQHIISAAGLIYGERGVLVTGESMGHDREQLGQAIRLVRTAVVDPDSADLAALRAAQVAWLRECDNDLKQLATEHRIGRTQVLGSVPLDPLLQWREQLISDNDVWGRHIANPQTAEAFAALADRILADEAWESL
jgi:hypothetical protein